MELKTVLEDGTEITVQDVNENTWTSFDVIETYPWRCGFLDLHLF